MMQEETRTYRMTDNQMINYLYAVAKTEKDLNINDIAARFTELSKQTKDSNNGV